MTRGRGEPVYEAEDHAFLETPYADCLGMQALEELAGDLLAHPWWVANGSAFRVVAARREARSSRAVVGPGMVAEVRIALGGECPMVLSHEAAHILANRWDPTAADHGQLFRRALLDVATVLLGDAGSRRLSESLERAGLAAASGPWEAPALNQAKPRGLLGEWLLTHRSSAINALGEQASHRGARAQ